MNRPPPNNANDPDHLLWALVVIFVMLVCAMQGLLWAVEMLMGK